MTLPWHVKVKHRTSRDYSAAASRFGADSRPFSSLPAPKLAGPAAPRSPVPHETPDRRDQSPVAGRRGMRASDSGAMRAAGRAAARGQGQASALPAPSGSREDSRLPQIARRKGGELPQRSSNSCSNSS